MPEIDHNKIHVTHLGPSPLFYQLNLSGCFKYTYILFVGARAGYKNFSTLVLALSMIKDINLVAVGGGYFTANEQALLEKYIPNRYVHMGLTSTEKLNELYNQALALAYPSSYEGFGIPILEAMQAGCPVIAINISSIPEVAGDSALLLDAADPELLRSAILSVCNTTTRNDLISRGIERARLFSWDKTFEQTLSIYENLNGESLERQFP